MSPLQLWSAFMWFYFRSQISYVLPPNLLLLNRYVMFVSCTARELETTTFYFSYCKIVLLLHWSVASVKNACKVGKVTLCNKNNSLRNFMVEFTMILAAYTINWRSHHCFYGPRPDLKRLFTLQNPRTIKYLYFMYKLGLCVRVFVFHQMFKILFK